MITINPPAPTQEPRMSVPDLAFPDPWIIAPDSGEAAQSREEQRMTVYQMQTAPIWAFNVWLQSIIQVERVDDALFLALVRGHRHHWDVVARWWAINALAVHGVDMTKHYFTSREDAESALKAREAHEQH